MPHIEQNSIERAVVGDDEDGREANRVGTRADGADDRLEGLITDPVVDENELHGCMKRLSAGPPGTFDERKAAAISSLSKELRLCGGPADDYGFASRKH